MSYADVTLPVGFLSDNAVDPRTILFLDSVEDAAKATPRPGQHMLILSNPDDERNTIKVVLTGATATAAAAGGDLPRVVFCDRAEYNRLKDDTAAPAPPRFTGKRTFTRSSTAPPINFCTPALLVQVGLVGPAGNIRRDMNGKAKYVLSMSGKPWCATAARTAALAGLDTTTDFDAFATAIDQLEDWVVYAMMHAYVRAKYQVATAGRITDSIKNYVRDFAKIKVPEGNALGIDGRLSPAYDEQFADIAHWLRDPIEYLRQSKSFAADVAACKALVAEYRRADDAASVLCSAVPAFVIRAAIDAFRRDTSRVFHGLLLPPDDKNPTRTVLMTRLLFQKCKSPDVYKAQYDEFKNSIDTRIAQAGAVSSAYAEYMRDQLALVDEMYSAPPDTYYFGPPKVLRVARTLAGATTLVPAPVPQRNSLAVARFQINASSVSGRCDVGMQPVGITIAYSPAAINPEYHLVSDTSYRSTRQVSEADAAMFASVDLSDTFGADDEVREPAARRQRTGEYTKADPGERSKFYQDIKEDPSDVVNASYRPATGGARGTFVIPSAE